MTSESYLILFTSLEPRVEKRKPVLQTDVENEIAITIISQDTTPSCRDVLMNFNKYIGEKAVHEYDTNTRIGCTGYSCIRVRIRGRPDYESYPIYF